MTVSEYDMDIIVSALVHQIHDVHTNMTFQACLVLSL